MTIKRISRRSSRGASRRAVRRSLRHSSQRRRVSTGGFLGYKTEKAKRTESYNKVTELIYGKDNGNNGLVGTTLIHVIQYLINFSLLIYSITPVEFMKVLNDTKPAKKIPQLSLILEYPDNTNAFFNFYIRSLREPSTHRNVYMKNLINSSEFKEQLKLYFTGPDSERNLHDLIMLILQSHFYYFDKNNNQLVTQLKAHTAGDSSKYIKDDITKQCSMMEQRSLSKPTYGLYDIADSKLFKNISKYNEFRIIYDDLAKNIDEVYTSLIGMCYINEHKGDQRRISSYVLNQIDVDDLSLPPPPPPPMPKQSIAIRAEPIKRPLPLPPRPIRPATRVIQRALGRKSKSATMKPVSKSVSKKSASAKFIDIPLDTHQYVKKKSESIIVPYEKRGTMEYVPLYQAHPVPVKKRTPVLERIRRSFKGLKQRISDKFKGMKKEKKILSIHKPVTPTVATPKAVSAKVATPSIPILKTADIQLIEQSKKNRKSDELHEFQSFEPRMDDIRTKDKHSEFDRI